MLKQHLKKYGTKTYNDVLRATDAACYYAEKFHHQCDSESFKECLNFIETNFSKINDNEDAYPPAYLEGVFRSMINRDGEDIFTKQIGWRTNQPVEIGKSMDEIIDKIAKEKEMK